MTKASAKELMRNLCNDLRVTCLPHEAARYLIHLGATDTELSQDFGFSGTDIQTARALSKSKAVPTVAVAWWPGAKKDQKES